MAASAISANAVWRALPVQIPGAEKGYLINRDGDVWGPGHSRKGEKLTERANGTVAIFYENSGQHAVYVLRLLFATFEPMTGVNFRLGSYMVRFRSVSSTRTSRIAAPPLRH